MKSKDFRIENYIRRNVAEMEPYSSARDEFYDVDKDMIFLDANENPNETEVNRYPDPQQRDLKLLLGVQKGIKPSNILLGNGSDEVLDLIFRAFCEPKVDNVISLPPTYGMYKVLAKVNDVENREVLLNEHFELEVLNILETQNNQSKLLFICSPNNPTGNTFSRKSIKKLLKGFKGIVVLDEAYIDFSQEESWLRRLLDFPNLIVVQTLSKAYGMAGIRLGLCFASEEIIAVLQKIKPPYNVNSLTQQYALNELSKSNKILSDITSITVEKSKLFKVLLQLKFIKKVFPSEANFLLVQVDDAAIRYQQLLDYGIVTRNRSSQPLCENTLRFSIGTPIENKRLINALKLIES